MPTWLGRHHVGCPARLEAASGDHLLTVSHLDDEGVEGAPQDIVGAVVERCQGRHVVIPVDQYLGGSQQLSWELCRRDLAGSSVESTRNSLGSAECWPLGVKEIVEI